MAITPRETVLRGSPHIKALLNSLHAENSRQESSWQRTWFNLKFLYYCLRNWGDKNAWNAYNDLHLSDQLLSHSKEKCELMYMLTRLNNARCVVECGTSFGISALYFALAVRANSQGERDAGSKVITIEKDASKVEAARKLWAEAGEDILSWIDAREGDLLEILAQPDLLDVDVDVLFLDAWTSLAGPALQAMLPRLRPGSLVFTDKTTSAEILYEDLLAFVRRPQSGFISITIPFVEGFEVMMYQPETE